MRVIVADDSVLFRQGLIGLLGDAGVDVVAHAGDAIELLSLIEEHVPDAALVDIRMPPTHTTEGLDAGVRIRAEWPKVAVLVLSQYIETRHVTDLLGDERGGVGYLLKERVADVDVLVDALERVCKGEAVIDPEVVAVALGRGRQRDVLATLSEREREILGLMAEGRSNAAICSALYLSPKTVETHVRSIFTKLDLLPAPDDHRRVLAVLTYLRGSSR